MLFEPYLTRWRLIQDGEPIFTHSSSLLPVRYEGKPAMLKIAREAEEKRGALLMSWWKGEGAAQVFACDEEALLLERVIGQASLAEMISQGYDDQASRIICSVAAQLHAPRNRPLPELMPLAQWFESLSPIASRYGGWLSLSAATAHELLSNPLDIGVLHGDLHHGNILDGGPRGWLAIDPKGLLGERGFDFANIFCNPDVEVATAPGRLARQVQLISKAAGLESVRLLQWIVAWTGLSAAWMLAEGQQVELTLAVAQLAAAELAKR